LNYFYWNYF